MNNDFLKEKKKKIKQYKKITSIFAQINMLKVESDGNAFENMIKQEIIHKPEIFRESYDKINKLYEQLKEI